MSDQLFNDDDQFWEDVDMDSILAILDEDMGESPKIEDAGETVPWSDPQGNSGAFHGQPVYPDHDPRMGSIPQQGRTDDFRCNTARQGRKEDFPLHSRPEKSHKGLIITLILIILLELAAIAGVLASWYLWLQ